ncbi:hypothetical protein Zmor_020621 [Zophobas morio]|uniref:UDP-glucuronosyltransferase n=1 Tax=Zophobas morio TaxID=2755281 RepID=A0AA38I3T8_9CUCU|nr:hypothetical protein Zmor_020621 [Zophobas morio]
MCTLFLLIVLTSVKSVLCANILYVSSIPSPSHHIWNGVLTMALVKRGHNVTLVDPDIDKLPKSDNYTHIFLEGVYESLDISYDLNDMASYSPIRMSIEFQNWCTFGCNKILRSEGLHNLLNYPPDFKFDLIIVDVTSGPCLYPLIHRFKYPPTIAVTAFLLPSYVSYNFGNNMYPTSIPWYGLPYTADMNFVERTFNVLYMYIDTASRYLNQYRREHDITKKIFGENIPSMEEFERHMSLVLTNTDPILDYPQPLAPNFISVGGLHTHRSNELPPDLKTILDNAKNGAIIFSLGTNIRSDKLDKRTQRALIDAFSKIPETVIWKFESDIENLPKNVIVRKWLPQNDALGHPNVKLFIGHGGALSTQESFYHGVPMICVPFIVDQHINAKLIIEKKLGLSIDFTRITSGYVLQTVREVLDNPVYFENVRRLSRIYKDKPQTALEKAVFWTEYVIRHGGADFLSFPGRNYPYYKVYGLDIILFLLVIIILILLIVYKIINLVLNLLISKRKIKVN